MCVTNHDRVHRRQQRTTIESSGSPIILSITFLMKSNISQTPAAIYYYTIMALYRTRLRSAAASEMTAATNELTASHKDWIRHGRTVIAQ